MELMLRLPDEFVERLAELLADRLRDKMTSQLEVIDAAGLAERLGRSREWVYDHAEELGAVRIGSRLSFEWPSCWEHYQQSQAEKDRCGSERSRTHEKPATTGKAGRRTVSASGTRAPLLPVKGSPESA